MTDQKPKPKPTPKPAPSHPVTRTRPWCRTCIIKEGLDCGQAQCPSYRKSGKEGKPKKP